MGIKNAIYGSFRTLCLAGLIITAACDYYTSPVPISDDTDSRIDTNALGTWAAFEGDSLEYAFRIDAYDERNYVLNCIWFQPSDEILDMYWNYAAHISLVGDQEYVNVRVLGELEKEEYFIFLYEIAGDSLFTYMLDANDFKQTFNTPEEFRAYILQDEPSFRGLFKPHHALARYQSENLSR